MIILLYCSYAQRLFKAVYYNVIFNKCPTQIYYCYTFVVVTEIICYVYLFTVLLTHAHLSVFSVTLIISCFVVILLHYCVTIEMVC